MTVTTNGKSDDSSKVDTYFELRKRLSTQFYDLQTGERIRVIANEGSYLFIFVVGYAFAVSHYYLRGLLDTRAQAAELLFVPASLFTGMTKERVDLVIYLVFHIAVLAVWCACCCQLLFGKKTKEWIKGTATFLT